ncbi:TPA: hypothetical protein DIV55_06570 [Patescibacteria group bacterium]|uniref:DNA 3'-5' helicase n=1 Tax=Candidatus Gottesmanbacteria bacterium GW2011_GWA1_43_11 TaxID=1618436 RepID=A0A0G1CL25_9BACT|nr:MAG: hypothetical protein UV59_C0002G0042 [Candidatus Gottesmanbacteria bacterium GW2011_GWA1_43_11]HCS79368.1 hypothetical protein [Patescibacteria group bacterium]
MHDHQEKVLNSEQEAAVHYGAGPLLIIAGAGTGKTTVITERIKHLIVSGLAKPAEVLALTFTEKAAREMEERVDKAMPYGYTQMWISTFHSFCEQILKQEAIQIGLNPGYHLLSEADATQLLRKNLFKLELDYFRPLGNPTKFISGMLQHFSRLQDEDVSPSQYSDWIKTQNSELNDQSEEKLLEFKKYLELANIYKAYEELKIKEGLMDFADLIANTLLLFRSRPNIVESYRAKFKYVLVDEFQDTNIAQYELIKLLAPPHKTPNLTVVGDDNQSIYKFRGAAISNILHFKEDYPQAAQIVLNQNYRSYQYILDGSYYLIKHNDPDTLEAKMGISKKLKSTRSTNKKLQIELLHAERIENEADVVAKEIKRLVTKTGSDLNEKRSEPYFWKDVALLIRANNHAEPFTRAFTRHGIPYQFLGPGQLFRQPEIKDLIAYLQVLTDFTHDPSFYRVLSMDYFSIVARDLVAVTAFSRRYGISLFEGMETVVGEKQIEKINAPLISEASKQKLTTIMQMIKRHLALLTKETAGQLLYYFLANTGMIKNILEYKFPIDEHKAQNIMKFFGKLKTYESEHEDASVTTVLDWIILRMELGDSPLATDTDWTENDAVNILTVHSAKGLEFPVVFLVNLVSARFPTRERSEQIPIPEALIRETLPEGDFHEEEERRLFYVGMTRARDRLFFTAANFYGEGKREKKMSPFVYEVLGEISTDVIKQTEEQLSLLDWKKVHPEATSEGLPSKHPITYLSYSQIDTFRMCPLHYKLRYLLKIQPSPAPALSFGTSMHAALKDIYELVKAGEKVKPENLEELLQKNWVREGYKDKQYEQAMWHKGVRFLQEFYKTEFRPEAKILALENTFTVAITKTQEGFLKIGGKIDRIDDLGNGGIEIIDYKTGRVPAKRKLDTNLQLSMYALAATQIKEAPFNRKPEQVKLSLYFFDTQEKISTTRTSKQLEKDRETIREIAKEIETSDFKCSGSELCVNCEYKLFCGIE